MRTILKFELETTDFQTIEMPKRANIISLQIQNRVPCIWALVSDESEKEKRYFSTFGTGHEVPYSTPIKSLIGTYQLMNGGLVFHVFEVFNQ